MASSNKTAHYLLSQYSATDKPTYMGDYNTDMDNIDTGIYNAQTKADSAYNLAGTAEGKADNAQLTANQALNSAGSANTNIGTMSNLNTTDKTSLVGAVNEVNNKINNINFTNYSSYSMSDVSIDNGTLQGASLYVATNSDGSLAKIYGNAAFNRTGSGFTTISFNSSLRPSTDITIAASGVQLGAGNGAIQTKIKTTGVIELSTFCQDGYTEFINFPCIYFVKDFGDTPQV